MYQSGLSSDLRKHNADLTMRGRIRAIHRNVWFLGITSLLTDMSSEMVVAVLPVYALYFLHVTPVTFGVIDGLQQGGASLVKLLSGFATDRTRRYKTIAASGYIASLLSRLGLLVAGPSATWLTPLVALDRIGKGIRTAPRDAIISLSVDRAAFGTAFGLHRTLDTIGALLGPLVGFAVLLQIRDGYDVVFVISGGPCRDRRSRPRDIRPATGGRDAGTSHRRTRDFAECRCFACRGERGSAWPRDGKRQLCVPVNSAPAGISR